LIFVEKSLFRVWRYCSNIEQAYRLSCVPFGWSEGAENVVCPQLLLAAKRDAEAEMGVRSGVERLEWEDVFLREYELEGKTCPLIFVP
jgi:hypothetical protein